jgi:capsular polysaccharide biosynthesis protein
MLAIIIAFAAGLWIGILLDDIFIVIKNYLDERKLK